MTLAERRERADIIASLSRSVARAERTVEARLERIRLQGLVKGLKAELRKRANAVCILACIVDGVQGEATFVRGRYDQSDVSRVVGIMKVRYHEETFNADVRVGLPVSRNEVNKPQNQFGLRHARLFPSSLPGGLRSLA